MRRCPLPALGLSVLLALAAPAAAAEWYESYRDGLKALAQGQAARAIPLLEAAAAARPEPGRNVITYGTNFVERYHPYLHLAEAHLLARDVDGARAALARSEKWGREPVEERRKLAAQVEELAARLAPKPVPTPVHTPTPAPPLAPVATATPPAAEATPAAVQPTPAPATPLPSPPHAPAGAAAPPPGGARGIPAPPAAPTPAPASLEVVVQPPAASVYLDDELIGTADAEWGRLVKSGIAPGRHRVRLALPGHRDLVEDVELAAGQRAELRRRLVPLPAPSPAAGDRPWLAPVLVAVAVALGVGGWLMSRRRAPAALAPATAGPFDSTGATPLRGTPPVAASTDGQGEGFGEYRLLERLGRGGMATVYKAERRGELCALKRPLATFLEEPSFRERFLREAEIGRTLHHPNIVRILEQGAVGATPFFTMELVHGETLQARLQRGAMEPREAASIVVQVAEALDYAHLKGVVHRDLKPSNVMLADDGTARVMDYGIARARRFEGLTATGAFLGTPEYVAPEAIEGRQIDARSDLYSLGVVLYEALTGRRPFTADTPFALLQKHLNERPLPPTRLRPGLPAELERIVLRLLSKRPNKRHPGAEELVLELRTFLNKAAAFLVAAVLVLAAGSTARAQNVSLSRAGSGARAAGMGDAFIAVSDDGTAASWNPAGLAQLRQPEFSLVYGVSSRGLAFSAMRSPDETLAFTSQDFNYTNASIDFASAAVPLSIAGRPVTLQAGWHRLYQLSAQQIGNVLAVPLMEPAPSTFYSRDERLTGDIDVISAAGAVKLTSRLSLGGSFDFWRGAWQERVSLVEDPQGQAPSFYDSDTTVEMSGQTFTVGLLLTYPSWNVGLVYHSPFWSDYSLVGQARSSLGPLQTVNVPDARFRLPRSIGFGLARRFAGRWTAAASVTHDQWTDSLLDGAPGAAGPVNFFDGLPPSISTTRDTLSASLGVEHLLLREGAVVPLRLGLGLEPQGGMDADTRDPVTYRLVSGGAGYNTNSFKFDAAVQYRWADSSISDRLSVANARNGGPPDALGRAASHEWRVKVSVIYRIGDTDGLRGVARKIFGQEAGTLRIDR